MGNIFQFVPSEWNNIPLPLVECTQVMLQEIFKLHIALGEESSKVNDLVAKSKKDNKSINAEIDKNKKKAVAELEEVKAAADEALKEEVTKLNKKIDKQVVTLDTKFAEKMKRELKDLAGYACN